MLISYGDKFIHRFYIEPHFIKFKLIGEPLANNIFGIRSALSVWFQYFIDAVEGYFEILLSGFGIGVIPNAVNDLFFMKSVTMTISD